MSCRYGTCLPKSQQGLQKFIDCPRNQGLNRMTRMLGDALCIPSASLGKAKRKAAEEDRMRCMLETAKRNLVNMCVCVWAWCYCRRFCEHWLTCVASRPYFALTGRIPESQALFEWTFAMPFKQDWSFSAKSSTDNFLSTLDEEALAQLHHANRFDVDLYACCISGRVGCCECVDTYVVLGVASGQV